MKKLCCLLLALVMLTGCSTQSAFETIGDILDTPVMAIQREIQLQLPKEATAPALQSDEGGKLYLCDGYTLTVQTLSGGDLDRTLREVTGFSKDQLTVMETEQLDVRRYDCVWSAAAEEGEQVARSVILDDGYYHYAVTVMADFITAGELAETWQNLLGSISLSGTD